MHELALKCWLLCDNNRILNFVEPIISKLGVPTISRLELTQLSTDSNAIFIRLQEEKPDLIWIMLSVTDSHRPMENKLQSAVKLLVSMQTSANRHCFLENINNEKLSNRGCFVPEAWLVEQKLRSFHVWWCSMEIQALDKQSRSLQDECAHVFCTSTLPMPDTLMTCCKKRTASGRSSLASRIPKAYYEKLACHVISALIADSTPNVYATVHRKAKPKPPKPGIDDGPDCELDVQDEEVKISQKRSTSKVVESVYDDCGNDISELLTSDLLEDDKSTYLCTADDDSSIMLSSCCFESDSECEEPMETSLISTNFLNWGFPGSETFDSEPLHEHECSTHFNDFTGAYAYVSSHSTTIGQHDICELFGGSAGTTKICIRRKLKAGLNFDITSGINLMDKAQISALWAYLEKHRPRVILAGPPCTGFGPWSRFNQVHHYETWHANFIIGLALARLTAAICTRQHSQGQHFIIENPARSLIWDLREFQALWKLTSVCHVILDQCQVGLRDPDGYPTRKSTILLASAWELIRRLNLRCPGLHQHMPLAGNTHGISRCKYAQVWPRRMLELLADGIEATLSSRGSHSYPVDAAALTCPGCRAHARRDDPRQSRVNDCRFKTDEPITWNCPSCRLHRVSTHSGHTFGEDCQWSFARQRHRGGQQEPGPAPPQVPASSSAGPAPAPLRQPQIPEQLLQQLLPLT